MADWSFLTNHGRALVWIAGDSETRLRDIAAHLGITERRAYGIVTDLTNDGYLVKSKEGRRSRYQVQRKKSLPVFPGGAMSVGAVLDLLETSQSVDM